MENKIRKLRNCALTDNNSQILELLKCGLDPNFEGGWPIRLAARHGSASVVRTLLQFGANPHLLGDAGENMAFTAAERAKRYGERLKQQNPEKYEEQRKKQSERLKKSRKRIDDLTEEEKKHQRNKWRNEKKIFSCVHSA